MPPLPARRAAHLLDLAPHASQQIHVVPSGAGTFAQAGTGLPAGATIEGVVHSHRAASGGWTSRDELRTTALAGSIGSMPAAEFRLRTIMPAQATADAYPSPQYHSRNLATVAGAVVPSGPRVPHLLHTVPGITAFAVLLTTHGVGQGATGGAVGGLPASAVGEAVGRGEAEAVRAPAPGRVRLWTQRQELAIQAILATVGLPWPIPRPFPSPRLTE